jgi:membrane-associated phospholipid phosphatase
MAPGTVYRAWRSVCAIFFVLLFIFSRPAIAGLDHLVSQSTGGIYRYYNTPPTALFWTSLGGALFLGSEDRLGRTFWKSSEAYFLDQAATEVLKRTTGRLRPADTDDPNQWRKGGHSFPSGHVSSTAAMVTPMILEYGKDHPAVWTLAVLPAYEMVARVKQRAHWQSDVIAGAALGTAVGYGVHERGPFVLRLLPGGAFVGFNKLF